MESTDPVVRIIDGEKEVSIILGGHMVTYKKSEVKTVEQLAFIIEILTNNYTKSRDFYFDTLKEALNDI
ncbi:MAG TPA: hypothetical protein PLS50_00600 [Candidatus Dojkabacteria bacterium]|nr:hypothetical protein [Candidatus Dojkabacteria bacterium]